MLTPPSAREEYPDQRRERIKHARRGTVHPATRPTPWSTGSTAILRRSSRLSANASSPPGGARPEEHRARTSPLQAIFVVHCCLMDDVCRVPSVSSSRLRKKMIRLRMTGNVVYAAVTRR